MRYRGLAGFQGGACQKLWLQRGELGENMACKGGGEVTKKKLPLSLVVIVCNNANISARMPKIAFRILTFRKSKFSGEHAPTPYFIIHPTTTVPLQLFRYVTKHSLGNVKSFWASAGLFLND